MGTRGCDVVVIGGGHNGLVAATLLARAGRDVCLLERSARVGGATAGVEVFPGVPARLSRYSYLISLWPDELSTALGVTLPLASRPVASYTPTGDTGLLVERRPGPATAASFAEVTGSDAAWAAWQAFGTRLDAVARAVGPALTGPLPRRGAVRDAVTHHAGAGTWDDLVERPLGEVLEREFADDLVRGIVATDGLIGTGTDLHDLRANRCFLYHVVGNGTGEWRVPIGGMGAVADVLTAAALHAGVEIRCDAPVTELVETADGVEVGTANGGRVAARHALAAVAPATLQRLLGHDAPTPEGAQLKVNMLLRRLPRLRSGADPAVAFAGTMHLEQGYDALQQAYRQAARGELPDPVPSEVYCHSLTDSSPVAALPGHHTLTLFGLHCPAALFREDPEGMRERATTAALDALQRHLAEPLVDCLATDADGRPCLEAATPVDLERSLGMPGGHIFHGDLDWPWLADDEPVDWPAQRWGVAVPGCERVLLAGAGSRRGGGVSGLGGWHAANALLEADAREN